jgi:hypothetical protein
MNDRYSPDWTAIARNKKQSVNWVCERCGVQCLKPGEGKGLSTGDRYRLRMAVLSKSRTVKEKTQCFLMFLLILISNISRGIS